MHFFGGSIGAALNAPVDNELGLLGLGKYKIKPAQQCFQKTVTWTKKSSSGARKWSQSCVESDLKPVKLITPVKTRAPSKVGFFSTCHEYKKAVRHLYGSDKVAAKYMNRDPYVEAWVVADAVNEALVPECAHFMKVQGSNNGIPLFLGDAIAILVCAYCDITNIQGWSAIT